MRIAFYNSIALVALGNIRLSQAISVLTKEGLGVLLSDETRQTLKRARRSLYLALALDGMEAETRFDGQLALVQVALLLGDLESAGQQVRQVLEAARQSEMIWMIARAQQLLGCIELEQNQPDLASQHFEQALRIFRKSEMRLEHARTLRLYGTMLMEQENMGGKGYQQGLSYLQDALKVFIECKAELDREMVERFLARHNYTTAK